MNYKYSCIKVFIAKQKVTEWEKYQNGGLKWNGNCYNINKIQYLQRREEDKPQLVVTT